MIVNRYGHSLVRVMNTKLYLICLPFCFQYLQQTTRGLWSSDLESQDYDPNVGTGLLYRTLSNSVPGILCTNVGEK